MRLHRLVLSLAAMFALAVLVELATTSNPLIYLKERFFDVATALLATAALALGIADARR